MAHIGHAVEVDLGALDTLLQHLDAAIVTVRRISTELWPRVLDDQGFEAAVRWQAAEMARRTGMSVDVELPASALVRGSSVKLALFRIVQEALTNVARHSGASRASVRLTNDETRTATGRDGLVGTGLCKRCVLGSPFIHDLQQLHMQIVSTARRLCRLAIAWRIIRRWISATFSATWS